MTSLMTNFGFPGVRHVLEQHYIGIPKRRQRFRFPRVGPSAQQNDQRAALPRSPKRLVLSSPSPTKERIERR